MSLARRSSRLASAIRLAGAAALALAAVLVGIAVAQLALSNGQVLLGGLAVVTSGEDAAPPARAEDRLARHGDHWRDAAWRRHFVLEQRRHRPRHLPLPAPA
jgi:hypothetical protein